MMVHFDVHGRRDFSKEVGNDDSDLDLGLGAIRSVDSELATELAQVLYNEIQPVLGNKFTVNTMPQLQGCCQNPGRMTLTQQSVGYGMLGVQLEFSMRLRRWLNENKSARHRLAHAMARAADTILEATLPKE
eukprot:TRINITY_DN6112_c0_g1_i19.p2 TRINITY_DN6112_c0_g1~~TRINITY_DN6112_c0_g1_i19.p2  ORF type:complete len:132 (-),score=23.49 TRINITY_DN6112_c0_g1_i19:54-449(-)